MSDKKSMQEVEEDRQTLLKEFSTGGTRRFTNMLDEMMALQKRFGSKWIDFDHLTTEQREHWTKEMVLAMLDELSEVLNQINFKHWKQPRPINELEMKYELIDLQHFLLELMLIWGMNEREVFSMFIAKMRENHRRQKEGY